MKRRPLALALGLLTAAAGVLLLSGCGAEESTPAAKRPYVTVSTGAHGHQLVVQDAAGIAPNRALPWLFEQLHAPAVHHDGKRVAFVGRISKHDPMRLFAGTLDERPPAPIEAPVDAWTRLAWLPSGRIVYSAAAPDDTRALFVTASPQEQGPGARITFGATSAQDPCVLKDGRVLYCSHLVGTDGTRTPALLTVRPDGTGVVIFHDATPGDRYARPWQRADGDVVFLARSGDTTTAWVVEWRAPGEAAARVEAPEPWLAEGAFAAARPRPQGSSTMVDPAKHTGTLLLIDARRGVDAPSRALRVWARVPEEDTAPAWKRLGRAPLAADGSCFLELPADTPLRLEVLGEGDRLLRASRAPLWLRRGEIRGLTSVDDVPDETPPNVRPEAVRTGPVPPRREGS